MSAPKLPAGWRVELLGLINAVQFKRNQYGQELLWCDGEWRIGTSRMMVPTRVVPTARTMGEARTVGTAWLNQTESDEVTK